MNTMYILSSLIASCDTLMVKFDKVAELCQLLSKKTETTDNDVAIVCDLCITVFAVAVVLLVIILGKKWLENRAINKERKDKNEKEKEESIRKKKSDLLDKKLEILKDLCYVQEGDKKRIKEASSPEIKDYIEKLENALKEIESAKSK